MRLGQKVKYKKYVPTQKEKPNLNVDDVEDELMVIRRKPIELKKERVGYVAGKRKILFKSIFVHGYDSGDLYEPPSDWIEIAQQKFKIVYLVAYNWGKTNYVLEEDLEAQNDR